MNTTDVLATLQRTYYSAVLALLAKEASGRAYESKGDAPKGFFSVEHDGHNVRLTADEVAVTLEVDGEQVCVIEPRAEGEPLRSWRPRIRAAQDAMLEPLGLKAIRLEG